MIDRILPDGGVRIVRVIVAVVPIKSFTSAKSRLTDRLDPEQRACLAQVTADRVLRAFVDCESIDARIAVVEDEPAARLAMLHKFEVMLRPDLWGQSAVVDAGFEEGRRRGADSVITVSADVPLTRSRDIEAMLKPAAPVLVMVSDREGTGTNAMRLSPPMPLRLHFGPDSLRQHIREAEILGLPVKVIDNARLRLDTDDGDDIDALDASGPEGRKVMIDAGRIRADQVKDDMWTPGARF
jgi:2-phospho-L-lactate guanylyltransferase